MRRHQLVCCPWRSCFRRRIFLILVLGLILSVFYITYQALSLGQLGNELAEDYHRRKSYLHRYQKADDMFLAQMSPASDSEVNKGMRIKGVRPEDIRFYIPDSKGNFKCLDQVEEIPFYRVNDDLCDCSDGSDEPSTAACDKGRFYCRYQPPHLHQSVFVLSNRVNDGICDCCDGSDEWAGVRVPPHARIPPSKEAATGVDQTPCRNRCLTV